MEQLIETIESPDVRNDPENETRRDQLRRTDKRLNAVRRPHYDCWKDEPCVGALHQHTMGRQRLAALRWVRRAVAALKTNSPFARKGT